ncbi:MAG: DNA polymerase III subunit gamma/tau [Parvibaculales bacterium]
MSTDEHSEQIEAQDTPAPVEITEDAPGFDMLNDADAENNVQPDKAYTVLARKYRPTNFDDLIGQQAMVRTLSNAFESGRIAHAFMLTGVRGVGKTTTARILARALNYQTDTIDQPNINLQEPGVHCDDIMKGRHVDIIEMDAASRTGIDDIREIIESVRYAPGSARYKVYIIDEVHMLSKAAFNGLLKTLEEPPEHVKFIFATTEIRKVPITVLSRCQRFDLRRLNQDETVALLDKVCQAENVEMPAEALSLIARVAEGSARDALSLLDRSFAHQSNAGAALEIEELRNMLGLADRGRMFDLFDHLMRGDIAKALDEFSEQFNLGADPVAVLTDLIELTHWLTRLKYVPAAMEDITIAESQRKRGHDTAEAISVRLLSRTWQVLLKGHAETLVAPNPKAAAEMVLIRLAHLADMPSPEELLKQWDDASPQPTSGNDSGKGAAPAGMQTDTTPVSASSQPRTPASNQASHSGQANAMMAPEPATTSAPDTDIKIGSFEQLIDLAAKMRDIRLKHALESGAHLVRFEPASQARGGVIELRLVDGQEDFSRDLSRKLQEWTQQRWMVSLSQQQGAATMKQVALNEAEQRLALAEQDAMVKQAKKLWQDAEIIAVTDMSDEFLPIEPSEHDDDTNPDEA